MGGVMPNPRITARILEDDYDAFRALVVDEEKLPPSYKEWLKAYIDNNKRHVVNGGRLAEVLVTPEGFAEYCQTSGIVPSYFALEEYAISQLKPLLPPT